MSSNEFVAPEQPKYRFQIGRYVASSLSGFIAGAAVATIIWLAASYLVGVE